MTCHSTMPLVPSWKLRENFYFSSRGRGVDAMIMEDHPYPNNVNISVNPGAGISRLTNLAVKDINNMTELEGTPEEHILIYIIGGICDISEKRRNPMENAEEVIFGEEATTCTVRVCNIIQESADTISSLGCKPIYATIPPMSISDWNWHRYNVNRTSLLCHHRNYESMQQKLIEAVVEINKFIIRLNASTGAYPPYLAGTVMVNTPGKASPRVHYSRFVDGVHASPSLQLQWAHQLKKAMQKNRKSLTGF